MTDFRRRNLMILGGAAALSVVLAAGALLLQAQETKIRFTPGQFLPGFSAHMERIRAHPCGVAQRHLRRGL